MTWLDNLLAQDVTKLLAVAIVLSGVVPVLRYMRGRNGQGVGVGTLVGRRHGTEETIAPAAAKYLDERIEHKVRGALAAPVMQITTVQADLRKDVERLDEEREEAGRDRSRVHARLENLERGQERMELKLDRLIERRER